MDKYIKTKSGIYEIVDFDDDCIIPSPIIRMNGRLTNCSDYKKYKQSNDIKELCDCFIIKYVESNTFSIYHVYEDAVYVYEHDKQNTTCILYGAVDTDTGLKYAATFSEGGLKLNE